MVEKTVLVRQVVKDKSECAARSSCNLSSLGQSSMIGNAQGSKAKTSRCDARQGAPVLAVGQGAIFDLAGRGACFLPEKLKRRPLNFIQELLVGARIRDFRMMAASECAEWKSRERASSQSLAADLQYFSSRKPTASHVARNLPRLYFNGFYDFRWLLQFDDCQSLRRQGEAQCAILQGAFLRSRKFGRVA